MNLSPTALQIADKAKKAAKKLNKRNNIKEYTEQLDEYLSTIRETKPNARLAISIDKMDYQEKSSYVL